MASRIASICAQSAAGSAPKGSHPNMTARKPWAAAAAARDWVSLGVNWNET
jgi:hypothetical protein